MRFTVALSAWLVLVPTLSISIARADDEEKIAFKELPKPVKKAVKAGFPGAKVTEAEKSTEDDETIYEVTLVHDEQTLSVSFDEEGEIQEIEYELDPKSLPRSVLAAIKEKFPNATIESAELEVSFEDGEETDTGKENYEVVLSTEDDGEIEVEVELEVKATLEVKAKETEEKQAKPAEKPSKADKKKAKKEAKRDKSGKKSKTEKDDDDKDKPKANDIEKLDGEPDPNPRF